MSITARAARARLGSSVSIRISASLRIRQSTSPIAATSESRVVSIQRFIESSAVRRAPVALAAHPALQVRLDVAQEEHVGGCDASESLGSKSANTSELGVVGVGEVHVAS